ncbi:MAG: RNA methyltransferase [Syntrophaceae bacterium]|nr:RNA methyltransferase [Syntrophaceae bacterium]
MIYVALLHYPVLNKEGQEVTTSVANMDIHDIARAAKTYGVKAFYIVNPIEAQREFAREIIRHWQEGYGAEFNRSRKEAFALIRIKNNLSDVLTDIEEETGREPQSIVTGVNLPEQNLKFSELQQLLQKEDLPYLLIFGTASGLAKQVIQEANFKLEPIKGIGDYSHLSVRSAAAIILDRIRKK